MERMDKDREYKQAAIRILENESQCLLCDKVMLEPTKLECNHRFCVSCLKKKFDKLPKFMRPKCPAAMCKKELANFDFKYSVDKGF